MPVLRDDNNSNVSFAYVDSCKVVLRIGTLIEKTFPQRNRLEEELHTFC
jgi:hypothetical protein